MSLLRIISAITKGVWMIEPNVAQGYLPLALAVLNHDQTQINAFIQAEKEARAKEELNEFICYSMAGGRKQAYKTYDEAPQGSIAMHGLQGLVMKNDFCGAAGTKSIASRMKEADAHPNIAGHVLAIDSGGGDVDGTMTASETYADLQKPKLTWVDGMMASAAYWLGSSAGEIMLSSGTDIVGSIGTMVTFKDYKGYFEEKGIKVHEIYASQSTEKNKGYKDALANNYDTIRQDTLDPLNEQFIAGIKKNRAGKYNLKDENIFTGKTYVGQAAIAAGLADSIGTIEQAIARASELAQQSAINQSNDTTMKIKFLASLAAAAAFFGFKAKEGADHVEGEVTPEKIADFNAKLLEFDALATKVKEQETAAITIAKELQDTKDVLAVVSAKKDKWKAKAIEFGAKSGNDGKKPVKEKTDELPGADKKDVIVDMSADHNRDAMKALGRE